MLGEKPNFLKRAALASTLAVAGMLAPTASPILAGGGCPSETYGISGNNESKIFNAKRAIVTGDVNVNGLREYDDRADTGAVNVFMSDTCKSWTVDSPYGFSVVVVGNSESQRRFYARESKAVNDMSLSHGSADVHVSK